MHWACAAILYIVFCEILPYCLLAAVYMVWYVPYMCTFLIVCIPLRISICFCGSALGDRVNAILEVCDNWPIWLGQKMGLSALMISPLDRNYIGQWREYRAEKESFRCEPARLSRTRKRRLSDGRKASQVSSAFLEKLPLEIRRMIYKEVVIGGSEHRHIIELPSRTSDGKRRRNRLWGAFCVKQSKSKCLIEDINVGNGGNTRQAKDVIIDDFPNPKDGLYGVLGLAKTCRQIYLEVIDIFYSSSNQYEVCRVELFAKYNNSIPDILLRESTSIASFLYRYLAPAFGHDSLHSSPLL